jgi:DNA helicase-2/ATP-dependent DNA helicase PcrA
LALDLNEKENGSKEEYIFEFYDEDFAESLEQKMPQIIETYNKIDFEKELNEEQLKIVNNIKGPMLVIAGAGSGKTRTIVYSVAKLLLSGIPPNQVMLVTFTNKASNEMIKRVETLLGKRPKGIWAGTFHSIANRFIRKYAKTLGLKPNYTIMDETDSKTLMKLSMEKAKTKEIEERFPTSAMIKEILSFSINCNKSIHDIVLWKYPQFDTTNIIKKLEELYKIYQEKKAKDNLVDFDDLLIYWNELLNYRAVAQSIAKNIKYVLVDEYQDTNYIQDEIIYKIVNQNPDHNVMAVGDDAQSIYAFRGANYQNILNFEKKYKSCKRYTITYNYRSVPNILDLANNSIEHNKKQFKKNMRAIRQGGIMPFLVNVSDEDEQARFIANQILKLRSDDYELNEMAVLIRAGSHSLKIELELNAKNIPYEVRAGVAFFERAHIKDVLVHLRIIENSYDEISWFRIFSIIPGIGSTSAAKIFQMISNTRDPMKVLVNKNLIASRMEGSRLSKVGIKNLVSHLKKIIDFSPEDNPAEVIRDLAIILENHIKIKYENWKDRIDDLKQLSIYAQNFPSIRKFLENLSLNLSNLESKIVLSRDQGEEEKPLVLSTIHRAKGLEWKVVFIPMLCEDFFPSNRVIDDPEAFEEERRVFYVAITRAKDHLYLLSPSIIKTYRGFQTARLSQFVSELNSEVYQEASVQFKSRKKSKQGAKQKAFFKSAFDLISNNKNEKE